MRNILSLRLYELVLSLGFLVTDLPMPTLTLNAFIPSAQPWASLVFLLYTDPLQGRRRPQAEHRNRAALFPPEAEL